MKFTALDRLMDQAKPTALSLIDKSKPYASKAWQYTKENPGDVLLGLLTFSALDIADSLDNIEEMDGYLFIDQDRGA